MIRKKILSIKAIFLSLTLMILSSASSSPFVHCTTTVEIGVITPNGVNEWAAMISIANDDINDYMASKGLDYRFTYFLEDAEGQAEIHLEHVKKFRSMGINLLIGGGWSSHAQASLSYINDNDMLLLSPSSTSPLLSIPNDNLFRLCSPDDYQARISANVMLSWGIDAVIVVYRGDSWGDGYYDVILNEFPAQGGAVVEGYRYPGDETDFNGLLSDVENKASGLVDEYGHDHVGILLVAFSEDENILNEAKNFDTIYNIKWFATESTAFRASTNFPVEAEHVTMFSPHPHMPDTSEWRSVSDRYFSMTDIWIGPSLANIYDVCWIYALSVFQTGSVDAQELKQVLPDIAAGYEGITGNCNLDENGDRPYYEYEIVGVGKVNGNIEPVQYAFYDHSKMKTTWDTDLITPIQDGEVTPVNIPPVAVINGPYSGDEDSEISFSSSGSHDPDGSIIGYSWDFGDGQTSTIADPSHTYFEPNTYTVTLRVTDNEGDTNMATTSCTVDPVISPDDGNGGFPWLPILAVLIVAVAAAAYFYMQKMKPKVKVIKAVDFDIGFEPKEIPADGKSTSIITIELLDSEGKPYEATEDTKVTISATGGLLVSSSEVKKDEATGATTITDSVKQAIESLLTQREEEGMRISIKQGETRVEAAIVSSLEVGDVTLTVSAPGVRRKRVRMRFAEKRRYCMHCGAQMSIDERACPKCGLMPPSGFDVKSCSNCGEVIPSQAKFCGECGAGQPSSQ